MPLFLLDSNHPLNSPWDRAITANIYAAGREKRLLQEFVLGVGGWRLVERLGIQVEVCHLNEGHAAFAVLARASSFAERRAVPFPVALRATRAGNVFTTHTPVDAAFDRFEPGLVTRYARPFIRACGLSEEEFLALGRADARDGGGRRSTWPTSPCAGAVTRTGSRACICASAAGSSSRSSRGGRKSEVPIWHVTNGVHIATWHSELANRLWGTAAPGEEALCGLLERAIVPKFYARDADGVPRVWIQRVRASMTRLTARFSSGRMVQEYVEDAYVPAELVYRKRAADGTRLAAEIDARLAAVDDGWVGVRFGRVSVVAPRTRGSSRYRPTWASCRRARSRCRSSPTRSMGSHARSSR